MPNKRISAYVRHMLDEENIAQRTPEWFAAREKRLTASDAAAAIGQNEHCSPAALVRRKTQPRTFFGNRATLHGQKHEDEAIGLYERLTGNTVHACGLFVHRKHDWLGGSPDGIIDTPASLDTGGSPESVKLLEVKCPFYKDPQPECPSVYYPQIQVCLEITGIHACDLVQYVPETTFQARRILIITVPRAKAWFDQQLPIMQEWHRTLQAARAKPLPLPQPRATKQTKAKRYAPYAILEPIEPLA